jgi:hypothetical protein
MTPLPRQVSLHYKMEERAGDRGVKMRTSSMALTPTSPAGGGSQLR